MSHSITHTCENAKRANKVLGRKPTRPSIEMEIPNILKEERERLVKGKKTYLKLQELTSRRKESQLAPLFEFTRVPSLLCEVVPRFCVPEPLFLSRSQGSG
jgi:hypothetical protein